MFKKKGGSLGHRNVRLAVAGGDGCARHIAGEIGQGLRCHPKDRRRLAAHDRRGLERPAPTFHHRTPQLPHSLAGLGRGFDANHHSAIHLKRRGFNHCGPAPGPKTGTLGASWAVFGGKRAFVGRVVSGVIKPPELGVSASMTGSDPQAAVCDLPQGQLFLFSRFFRQSALEFQTHQQFAGRSHQCSRSAALRSRIVGFPCPRS